MVQTSPDKYRYWIYFFGLFLMVVGLPLSKFLMSVAQIILAANWLLDKDVLQKFRNFFRNKTALIFSSVMLMHFIGCLYSTDWSYAWGDIRIKAPLLIFPVIISTSPVLDKKHFHLLMGFFVASVAISTFISLAVLHGIIHSAKCAYPIVDVRDISIFISHIRLSLLICLSVFILAWYVYHQSKIVFRIGFTLLITWFIKFLMLLESLTGLAVLGVTAFILLTYLVLKQAKSYIKFSFIVIIISALASGGIYLHSIYKSVAAVDPVAVDFSKLEKTTALGNAYEHDSLDNQVENGNYVRQYMCLEELMDAWPQRSSMDIGGKDRKGNYLTYTLTRYLTSKGLRKDAEGFKQLSDEDIKAIERGVANVNYKDASSLSVRLKQSAWELDNYVRGGNPNGHSMTQRMEYWKCAMRIIKENFLIGVGTGDAEIAYADQYQKMNTRLAPEWRLHAHNQFLSIGVGFGLIGIVWFLFALIYPAIREQKFSDYFFVVFFIIALCSFMNEDTLETQAGVSFFAFFYCLFMWKPQLN